jgi:hypothetical protein
MFKYLVDYILWKCGRICDFAYYNLLYAKTGDIQQLLKVRHQFWCGACLECLRLNVIRGTNDFSATEYFALKDLAAERMKNEGKSESGAEGKYST